MDLGIAKRVAIVTGSSRGKGKAISTGLAREGAKVVICARTKDELEKTAIEIESLTSSEVLPLRADLMNEENVNSLVKTTADKFGKVDILVNNTGGPQSAFFQKRLRRIGAEPLIPY